MTIREQLSMNLARFRVAAGLSQKTAAEKLNTKPTTISSWERGVSQPSADMLVKIAMLYRVTLSDLCGADYDQKITPEEKDIIMAYRQASDDIKNAVRAVLRIGG